VSEALGRPKGLGLTQSESPRFLPLAVPTLAVDIDGLLMVARDFVAAHMDRCHTV